LTEVEGVEQELFERQENSAEAEEKAVETGATTS
jgi:hypothetical protein